MNIVPDALLYLRVSISKLGSKGTLNTLYTEAFYNIVTEQGGPTIVYYITLVEILSLFKDKLAQVYKRDP